MKSNQTILTSLLNNKITTQYILSHVLNLFKALIFRLGAKYVTQNTSHNHNDTAKPYRIDPDTSNTSEHSHYEHDEKDESPGVGGENFGSDEIGR